MTKVIAQTYSYAQQYRALITLALIGASVSAILFYCANLYRTVSHTISIQSVHAKTVALTGEVSDLDARYLELASAVTPDAVASYGLTQSKVTAFIPRTPATASAGGLASRGNEF